MTVFSRRLWLAAAFAIWGGMAFGQSVDDCLMCHGDPSFSAQKDGRQVSLYFDESKAANSIHRDLDCVSCHSDLIDAEFPHKEDVAPADCGACHDSISSEYEKSLHGQAIKSGVQLAPRCPDCHGSHDIVSIRSVGSKVSRLNIPFVCGRCHKEGTEVSRTYDIPQDSILDHYSESIHGEGLLRQGLIVTAVCSDCHTAHSVLPHTDKESSIYRDNVPKTCQKCHGLIEQVHIKVVRGQLWEKEPNKVPVCVDCHSPHKIRRIFYNAGLADQDCLACHDRSDLTATRDGKTISMFVDSLETHNSIHRKTACAQCHAGVSPEHKRPCEPITAAVDCSICHEETASKYKSGIHGALAARGDPNAPSCLDCHGKHDMRGRRDEKSPTYPTHVPDLCGKCHREGNKAAMRYAGEQRHILENYAESVHGKGLLQSGLVVTAMCSDCHTAHQILPMSDPASSVNRANLPDICGRCHNGIQERFSQSIHSATVYKGDKPIPSCSDCHQSHTIMRTDSEGFKLEITGQCGKCHKDVTETYFDTFHGKVSKLGYTTAAKCYDCHGSHNILPPSDPKSTLSRQNIVATCGACHAGSHRRFAGYLTHATHHDKTKYPILYYTFWFMTILLTGTLAVAGTHTLLWFPRSYQAMKAHKKLRAEQKGKLEYVRFSSLSRRLHILVIISFIGLALTGMTLKFSYLAWAQWLSKAFGGFQSAGYIHRVCALITFFYFGAHIYDLVRRKRREKITWRQFLSGPNSMLPQKIDFSEAWGSLKWFLGLGPRPAYGRWTYWEKFDYFAVFWGVVVIGSTGLMLWFPEFFTRFLPGWFINVATIVHSDEALLATGFIFTVHFFNAHFRPDKFPMDTVIFTGRVPLEELKTDRPREYETLIKSRDIRRHLAEPLPDFVVKGFKIFGALALFIGISLILLIIWAEVFGYK
jgi:cytochrome b subunit of formate dehydrogenase